VMVPFADQIEVALIFGSFASGEHRTTSDVDILIVIKNRSTDIEKIGAAFQATQESLGREINPVVFTIEDWRLKRIKNNPFIQRVLDGTKTFLIGGEDELDRLAEKRIVKTASDKPPGNRRLARDRRA
jgi:predicted nucleotidyltransferase